RAEAQTANHTPVSGSPPRAGGGDPSSSRDPFRGFQKFRWEHVWQAGAVGAADTASSPPVISRSASSAVVERGRLERRETIRTPRSSAPLLRGTESALREITTPLRSVDSLQWSPAVQSHAPRVG